MARLKVPLLLVLSVVLSYSAVATGSEANFQLLGPQGVNLQKLDKLSSTGRHGSGQVEDAIYSGESQQTPLEVKPYPEFEPYWFEQPLDHFSIANSTETFRQRYWINVRHYKPRPGAPVIVIDGGETSGEDRLPFLDTGIADIVASATGGIGVVLEHRYYGKSIAVQNLTTDSLRFLNNAQAAADSARFMAHVKFPNVKENMTALNTPWIYYGGSYAGARAAHMKILYPELVFGAIASSAVTHASLENWEYMEVIRNAADPKCAAHLENAVRTIDGILTYEGTFAATLKRRLKALFGLEDLEHDEDFVSVVQSPLGYWQSKNWDPAVGSTKFDEFCAELDKPIFNRPGPAAAVDDGAQYDASTNMMSFPDGFEIDLSVWNYAKYVRERYVSKCPVDKGTTIDECFGTWDDSKYQGTSLDDTWRLWIFQVCTEWGYFFSAPPPGLPRIVSSLLTLEYASKTCRQAFPPGDHFKVPAWPNVTIVNALGDFGIAADKLAFIDGEVDPWRPCTPHSDYASDRPDTVLRPFKVIPGAVHHWDENGLRRRENEPPEIQKIHAEIVEFVTAWLKDWENSDN